MAASVALLAAMPALAQAPAQAPRVIDGVRPVTDAMLRQPEDGSWLMWRRTYDGWGYSPLNQINKQNVRNLQVAWTWTMNNGPTELTPIVHDGVIFIFHNNNKVEALDAATGNLIWAYRRELPAAMTANPLGNQSTRNMAIYNNLLIVAATDATLIGLDVKTGRVVWQNQVGDWSKGWRYTSGPMLVNGTIVQSMTGCGNAQPGGCFVTGHDPATGRELWRLHTIARPGTPGDDTWNALPLESRFGGSAWIGGSYDAEQDVFFIGTGQPYPWVAEMNGLLPLKPGANNDALFTDTTLALNPKTGERKWHHQWLKNDTWDLDYVYEQMIFDLPVGGQQRKLLVTTGKLGIIEAIDRNNGNFVWSKQTVYQNVVQAIDPRTGAKTINPAAVPRIGQTTVNCPADPGGRGWPASAYSPLTGNLYLTLNEFCSNTTPQPLDPGAIYTGGGRATFARVPVPNSDGNIGRVDAVKLTDQSTTFSRRTRSPVTSAQLPTGGGVVFSGTWDRYFRALDDTTGQTLWQIRTNNAVNSFPVTYSAGGKQYVAVVAGQGASLARSWATLTPELVNPDSGGTVLWVFALPN
jgi:alcohol dehydrogenase (cytochrome c)